MARNNDRDRGKRILKDTPVRGRKRSCAFCQSQAQWVDYKDANLLRRFLSDRGKIRARRATGNCAQHQREVAVAIKTARELALMPYAQRTVTERGPGRGARSGPGRHDQGPDTATTTGVGNDLEDLGHDADNDHELEEVDA
jgi:small subunit ribosomal protein S18